MRNLEKEFHNKFAWYPVKLSSGKWIFGKQYWVRYNIIVTNWNGVVLEFHRGRVKERLDSEELVLRKLSNQ